MNNHDFGPLPSQFPGPKAEKQINLDLVKALRRALTEAENGDILFFAGASIGPQLNTTEYMILQPGPPEPIMHLALAVCQAKIVGSTIQQQGPAQKPSAILKAR